MSLDNLWNNDKSPSENKAKDFNSIDISEIKQNYEIVHQIQEMELVDSGDNQVTIPSELQDYFPKEEWNKLEQFKNTLYEKLWLKPNLEENSEIEKFEKWFIDWLLVENIEMLDSLTDKSLDELVQMIKQLSNWEVIVAIVEDLYDSMWDILETFKEPYKWWLALWWFWLWVIWKWMKWLKVAEKLSWVEKLYEIKDYKFLEKHKDILWEDIKVNDIVWEWTQAIIMKHPNNEWLVIKIAKEWQVDDIIEEFNNHKLFYDTWEEWLINWDVDLKVRIPKVFKWKNEGHFYMEKIDWQSLYSKTLIERFDKKLDLSDKKILEDLSDKEVREFLKNKFWENDSYLDMLIEDYSVEHLAEQFWTSYMYRKKYWKIWDTPLSNTLDYLKKKWISHNDLHPWNVMLDKKWNVYIIDFWRIKLLDNK